MEPRRFTAQELEQLVGQAVLWMEMQREKYYAVSEPLSEAVKAKLRPFFPEVLVHSLRIKDVSKSGETIPYPPFYERVRAGGSRVVPDAAHMTAIPFLDVALFNREPTLRTIFHNLVHVTQFAIVGLDKAMRDYFRTINETGLWMVVPYEQQAYTLDARYTRNPAEVFSVEAEVREWMRSGKY